jgi:phage tail protein X
MPKTVTTKQGDTVDMVAWRVRGRTDGVTEAILDANPGVASVGAVLPMGTVLVVPEAASGGDEVKTINLWD